MLSSRTATRAAASRPSARTAAPPPLSGPRRASATPVPRAHPLPSKSVIPRALDSERDRIAHDLLGAESYQALPNDLKAAVAETAGDEQTAPNESLCYEGFATNLSPQELEEYKHQASGLPLDFQDDPSALPDNESAPIDVDTRGGSGTTGGARDM